VALRDGVVVVVAPSAGSARWIGRHLTDELAELSRSMGAPLGLVVEPETAP
jgi:ribosomal protein S18 acetylase RimI-like enzyme